MRTRQAYDAEFGRRQAAEDFFRRHRGEITCPVCGVTGRVALTNVGSHRRFKCNACLKKTWSCTHLLMDFDVRGLQSLPLPWEVEVPAGTEEHRHHGQNETQAPPTIPRAPEQPATKMAKDMTTVRRVNSLHLRAGARQQALKTLEAVRPCRALTANDLVLLYTDLNANDRGEIYRALATLGFRTGNIYSAARFQSLTELTVASEYEAEFRARCDTCGFAVYSREEAEPLRKTSAAVIRHFKQMSKANIQQVAREFFLAMHRELQQRRTDAQRSPTGREPDTEAGVLNKAMNLSYLNVQGLSECKLNAMLGTVQNTETVLFLAETWFCSHSQYTGHPWFVAESRYSATSCGTRGKNGIALFAPVHMHRDIWVTYRSQHALAVRMHSVNIAAVYLPPSLSNAEVLAEMQHVAGADIIIGDLNARMLGGPCASTAGRKGALSLFMSTSGHTTARPANTTGHNLVDHVLCRGNIAMKGCWVFEPVIKTDHPQLQVVLRQGTERQGGAMCRYALSRLHLYREEFNTLVGERLSMAPRCGDSPDSINTTLVECLQASLLATVGTRSEGGSRHSRKTTSPAQAAKQFARAARSHTPELRAQADLDVQEEVAVYFERMYTCEVETPDMQCNEGTGNIPQHLGAAPHSAACCAEGEFHREISTSDVVAAIGEYPVGKAPGPDGLDNRVFRTLSSNSVFVAQVTALFNHCLVSGDTPRQWNTSLIVPIAKPGKDSSNIANCRPVSLTAVLRRIFEKILLPRIEDRVRLDRGQGGFRKGFSCLTQVVAAEHQREQGKHVAVFLDLASAYDTVDIGILVRKLRMRGAPGSLVRLVASLFTECRSVAVVNGATTRPVLRTRGLFQGSLLAPILFNVYIDDLAVSLNTDTLSCLLFADDILLQTRNTHHMQQMLDAVAEWCRANHMHVNVRKSGTFTDTALHIGGNTVPTVQGYRYLGVTLTANGLDTETDIAVRAQRASASLTALQQHTGSEQWTPSVRLHMYKTFVRTQMEYGAPLVRARARQADLGVLEKVQNRALQWVFQRRRPLCVMRCLANILPVAERFRQLSLMFTVHMAKVQLQSSVFATCVAQRGRLYRVCSSVRPAGCRTARDIQSHFAAYKHRGRLCGVIAPECRDRTGADMCLTIGNPRRRRAAISWRCGIPHHKYICAVCSRPFTRQHVNTCIVLHPGTSLLSAYAAERATYPARDNYNVLDFLLNRRKYKQFSRQMQCLHQSLLPATEAPPKAAPWPQIAVSVDNL
jgi:uncharacterized protein Smg (DUF494 family)